MMHRVALSILYGMLKSHIINNYGNNKKISIPNPWLFLEKNKITSTSSKTLKSLPASSTFLQDLSSFYVLHLLLGKK